MSRQKMSKAIGDLRKAAIITNSAVAAMTRAAAKSNPDKMLRCWTAEQEVQLRAKLAKGGK